MSPSLLEGAIGHCIWQLKFCACARLGQTDQTVAGYALQQIVSSVALGLFARNFCTFSCKYEV